MTDAVPPDFPASIEALIRREMEELASLRDATRSDRAPVELDQQSVGRLSRMDSLQVQAMSNAAEARRSLRMRQLEAALKRIAQEDFGYCSACGEFIGLKRLETDPAAVRCVSCAR